MKSKEWYAQLKKPTWAPPAWIFGPVWSILYIIIIFTYGSIFLDIFNGRYPIAIGIILVLNLFFNFIFTYIQFVMKNNILAAIDIILVLLTIILSMIVSLKVTGKPVFLIANIPYLAWVSFATVLQFTITFKNLKNN